MNKSSIVLVAVIAGVLWYSKDYLSTKKDVVVSQVDEIRAGYQESTPTGTLKEFGE